MLAHNADWNDDYCAQVQARADSSLVYLAPQTVKDQQIPLSVSARHSQSTVGSRGCQPTSHLPSYVIIRNSSDALSWLPRNCE